MNRNNVGFVFKNKRSTMYAYYVRPFNCVVEDCCIIHVFDQNEIHVRGLARVSVTFYVYFSFGYRTSFFVLTFHNFSV